MIQAKQSAIDAAVFASLDSKRQAEVLEAEREAKRREVVRFGGSAGSTSA